MLLADCDVLLFHQMRGHGWQGVRCLGGRLLCLKRGHLDSTLVLRGSFSDEQGR